jgi:hypothetical protein
MKDTDKEHGRISAGTVDNWSHNETFQRTVQTEGTGASSAR